uniref:hypothetical protein n=1 Tax=uncultured Erythrobacter sp. TaxID=263913 RepID=UPI002639BF67|nr:hypothetical protein [uncultured Erythrobacter sp.]
MAQAELTQQSVIEAGIAASLASDPELLPEPSIWFQDFTFGGTMFDAAFGNAEALGGVGEAISDVAIDNRLELERKEREENDPAKDAGMIVELAASQREEIAAMSKVTYSDGQFHMFGMDIDEEDMDASVAETLENIDDVAARHGLDAQQTANLTNFLVAYQSADTPEEKAEILGQIAEAHPEVAQEMAEQAPVVGERRRQNELTDSESVHRNVADLEQQEVFIEARADTLDEEYLVSEHVAVREGRSVASTASPEALFDMAAYSPAEEFNLQGLDGVRVADAEPVQAEPGQSQSQPVQEFRV